MSQLDGYRCQRYRRRCHDNSVEGSDSEGVSTLCFEDCFMSFPSSPTSLSSSCSSSRSESPLMSARESPCSSSRQAVSLTSRPVQQPLNSIKVHKMPRRKSTRSIRKCANISSNNAVFAATTPISGRNLPPKAVQTSHKHSPSSVMDIQELKTPSTDSNFVTNTTPMKSDVHINTEGLSLSELLDAQSSKSPRIAYPSLGLQFTAFDRFEQNPSFQEEESCLAIAINAIIGNTHVDDARAAVQPLLTHLTRVQTSTGYHLNAVTCNRLVQRLVELRECHAATIVLNIMAQDDIPFTTVCDDWVLKGLLDAAVNLLRDIVRYGTVPRQSTMDYIFLSWINMGLLGRRAALAVNSCICEVRGQLTIKRAEGMIRGILGTPASNSYETRKEPTTPESEGGIRILEQMLHDVFCTSNVTFEDSAIASLLLELERGSERTDRQSRTRRHLIEVTRAHITNMQQEYWDLQSYGVFVRTAIRDHRLDEATDLLNLLPKHVSENELDLNFVTSILHVLAAAVKNTYTEVVPGERLAQTISALCNQIKHATQFCVKYSVLNRVLLILVHAQTNIDQDQSDAEHTRLCDRVAHVALALFDGLYDLHSKAVNRRTFDRLFDLLLRVIEIRTNTHNAEASMAVIRIQRIASSLGFLPCAVIAERLSTLGFTCGTATSSGQSSAIDIEVRSRPRRISFDPASFE